MRSGALAFFKPVVTDLSSRDSVRLSVFSEQRPHLFAVAYRMLGSVADAEDLLQDAFIRWQLASDDEIRSPKSYLVTVVSRLCINHLQSALKRREQYVGQWLPEPLVTEPDPVGDIIRIDESLSMAFLVLLERLTPLERAVLLLHDVFGFQHSEIGAVLGQRESTCRQNLRRAKQHIGSVRRRVDIPSAEHHRALLERFLGAARGGDVEGLLRLLSSDVALHVDGGPEAPIPNVIRGRQNVLHGLLSGAKQLPKNIEIRVTTINGDPGIVSFLERKPYSVLVLEFRDDLVQTVYIITSRQKMANLRLPPLT